jgi:iron complex outermembrane receptor protein
MDVARIDNNKWAVGVRGFNDRFNGKLLVQVDGRTVYNPLSSGVYWDAVDYPLEDIERIEIIRGPGASVWGANAVNGVINIITRPAADTQGTLFSGGAGTEERGFGTLRYGGGTRDAAWRAYAKAFTRDHQFSLSGESPDDWSGASGGFRFDRSINERDAVTLQGDLLRSIAQRKDFRPLPIAPFSFVNVEDERTRASNLLTRWSRTLDAAANWSLQMYWDRFDREGGNGFVDLRWDTFDVDFQQQLPLGARQTVTYGVGYRYIDALLGPSARDSGFAVSFAPAGRHTQLVSAFMQDQITLLKDTLKLTIGSKFEHNDHTGFEVQPTARLLWIPTVRHSAWAAVSRAVRTPTLSEDAIGSRQLPSFPPAFGGAPLFARLSDSPDFESEELVAYELGFRTQASDMFSVDTAAFYNDYNKLRVAVPGTVVPGAVPGTFDLPLTFQNRMSAETYGVELAANWRPAEFWRLNATYTLLEMHLHADASLPTGVIASSEAPERQNPQQQLSLHSSWNLPHNVELDLTSRFVDRLTAFTPVVDDYLALDARLAWQPSWNLGGRGIGNLELALVGRNLLDNRHAESGTAPLLSSLLVEIERAIHGTVTIDW